MLFLIDKLTITTTFIQKRGQRKRHKLKLSTWQLCCIKVFPEVEAVSNNGVNLLTNYPVEISNVEIIIACSMPKLSNTYTQTMPDWVVPKYFDPVTERHKLLTLDYQKTEIQQIRCMQNNKPVDSIEPPLESLDNVLTAVNKVLSVV